jgi:hypothetical protein
MLPPGALLEFGNHEGTNHFIASIASLPEFTNGNKGHNYVTAPPPSLKSEKHRATSLGNANNPALALALAPAPALASLATED